MVTKTCSTSYLDFFWLHVNIKGVRCIGWWWWSCFIVIYYSGTTFFQLIKYVVQHNSYHCSICILIKHIVKYVSKSLKKMFLNLTKFTYFRSVDSSDLLTWYHIVSDWAVCWFHLVDSSDLLTWYRPEPVNKLGFPPLKHTSVLNILFEYIG